MVQFSMISMEEYSYEFIHKNGCGGVIAYTNRKPITHDELNPVDFIYPNGEKPQGMMEVVCGSCGKHVEYSEDPLRTCYVILRPVMENLKVSDNQ